MTPGSTLTLGARARRRFKAWTVKFKDGTHPVKLAIPARLFKKVIYVLTFKVPAKLPRAK